MSGLFSQVGFANETRVPPVSTAGTSVAATIGSGTFLNTLTFGSAHGCVPGDVITLTGYTPSAWNDTFTVYQVPSATTLTFITLTTLAAVTVQGTIVTSDYGSTVAGAVVTPAPSRFTSFISESFKLIPERMSSMGIGGTRRAQLSTRGALGKRSGAGTLKIEVESKGFGFWLPYMVGPVVTTGPTDSAYTHTASFPTGTGGKGRLGKSFNFQPSVVPVAGTFAELVKTYLGCKVISWQFNFERGKLLTIDLTTFAQDEKRSITKATFSPATNPELLAFAGGTIQLAGQTWDVIHSGSIKVDLGYDTDRWSVNGSNLSREPAEATWATITVDITGEFDGVLTVYDKVETGVYSQTMAQVNLAFVGKILIGATTFPSLTFNIPVARFEGDTPTTDGPVIPTQHLTAIAMYDGSNSPISAAYVTVDSTP